MNPLFSPPAIKILQLANQESQLLNTATIGSGQILLALFADAQNLGSGPIVFEGNIELLRDELGKLVQTSPEYVAGKLPMDDCEKKAIENEILIRKRDDESITPLHLLIGILQEEDSIAIRVLGNVGMDPEEILREALEKLSLKKTC